MATNVLQSHLNKSRKDKFLLSFNSPTALKKTNENIARGNLYTNIDSVQFSVYGALVPTIEVPAVEIRFGGNTLYQSSHAKNSYPPVTVNFTVDNRFSNYWMIYSWLNLLHNEKTGVFDSRQLVPTDKFDEYQTDIIITALDEYDNSVASFQYVKAFPTTIGDLNFNYRDSGEIECQFTFVYSQLYINLVDIV